MASLPTLQQLQAEAITLGMDLITPVVNDYKSLEELKAELEALTVKEEPLNSPPIKPTHLQLLEAVSSYLTSAPEDNECAICVLELVTTNTESKAHIENDGKPSTAIKLNTCGHMFHSECLLDWLRKTNTCPFCRRRVCKEDIRDEAMRSPWWRI